MNLIEIKNKVTLSYIYAYILAKVVKNSSQCNELNDDKICEMAVSYVFKDIKRR